MGFAKSQTEAYYLLSEKTRELDSPPELLALCGARESGAAPATLAPVWEERRGPAAAGWSCLSPAHPHEEV